MQKTNKIQNNYFKIIKTIIFIETYLLPSKHLMIWKKINNNE